jgi:hypothetical protein
MTTAASPAPPPAPNRKDALAVVDLAAKATDAYGRPDLGERLTRVRTRLTDAAFHVFVVGEFKQGKSTLINALLNAPVCAVDDDIATAIPTFVHHAEQPLARVVWEAERTDDTGADERADAEPVRSETTVDEARRLVVEAAGDDGRRAIQVEIGLPRRLLGDGLVLVDTPGVGGLGSTHTATTIGALPMADAVLFVTDASQELSASELEFLRTAIDLCPHVSIVLTKTDFYPAWRQIADLDRGHLARAGLDLRILPVSSSLRQAAVAGNDRDLNAESGFAPLVSMLTDEIGAAGERIVADAAAREVLGICDQLASQFEAEREVLADPDALEQTLARLRAAKDRADQLRSQLAKWQQTLGDGMADLQSDIDFDLRQRFRVLLRQGDEAIDDSDPIKTWPEFEPWLYHRVAEDITNNYRFLHHRSNDLAGRVASHFELDESGVTIELAGGNPASVMDQVAVDAQVEMKKMSASMQMLSGVRGGYYGGLMFTALGGMAGLALGPIAIGAGLILGRKALRDEKERALMQRRQTAKNAVRKYTDEVTFLAGADSRNMLRRIQRQLRDHFSLRAEELQRSTAEALQAAQQGAQTDQTDRQARLRDVEAELKRITQLRGRAAALGRAS